MWYADVFTCWNFDNFILALVIGCLILIYLFYCSDLQVGDIVTSPYGDSVIKQVRPTPFGFPIFDIEILDSGERQTVNHIALSKIPDIQELSQEVSLVHYKISIGHFSMP